MSDKKGWIHYSFLSQTEQVTIIHLSKCVLFEIIKHSLFFVPTLSQAQTSIFKSVLYVCFLVHIS